MPNLQLKCLQNNDSLRRSWLAGNNSTAYIRKICKRDIQRIDFEDLCASITKSCWQLEQDNYKSSLEFASKLVNGAVKMYQQKVIYLLHDVAQDACKASAIIRDIESMRSSNKEKKQSLQSFLYDGEDLKRLFYMDESPLENLESIDLGNTAPIEFITLKDTNFVPNNFPIDDQFPCVPESEKQKYIAEFFDDQISNSSNDTFSVILDDRQRQQNEIEFWDTESLMDIKIPIEDQSLRSSPECKLSLTKFDNIMDVDQSTLEAENQNSLDFMNFTAVKQILPNLPPVIWDEESLQLLEKCKPKRKNRKRKNPFLDAVTELSDDEIIKNLSDYTDTVQSMCFMIKSKLKAFRLSNTASINCYSDKFKYLHSDLASIIVTPNYEDMDIGEMAYKVMEPVAKTTIDILEIKSEPKDTPHVVLNADLHQERETETICKDTFFDDIILQIPFFEEEELAETSCAGEITGQLILQNNNAKSVLRKLLHLWSNDVKPINMQHICGSDKSRKNAATSFYSILHLLSMQYVFVYLYSATQEIKHIRKGDKLLHFV